MIDPGQTPVTHNTEQKRFELDLPGGLSVLEYLLGDGKIIFTHTGVPQALEGQGIGSRLARAGLDFAQEQNLRVVPICSFIASYIGKHPEYQALVEGRKL